MDDGDGVSGVAMRILERAARGDSNLVWDYDPSADPDKRWSAWSDGGWTEGHPTLAIAIVAADRMSRP